MALRTGRPGRTIPSVRFARGKVVGNTVVLEEPLPDGAQVTVVAGADDAWELDEQSTSELLQAVAAADRGELVDYASVLARLPRTP